MGEREVALKVCALAKAVGIRSDSMGEGRTFTDKEDAIREREGDGGTSGMRLWEFSFRFGGIEFRGRVN